MDKIRKKIMKDHEKSIAFLANPKPIKDYDKFQDETLEKYNVIFDRLKDS